MASSLFGKYAVVANHRHEFLEEPTWWWDIKPVNSGMELEMSKFLAHRRVMLTKDGRTEMPPTAMEIGFREVALTFAGTNIPARPEDETGEPILKAGATVEQIEALLSDMPRPLFMELWRAVGESYPFWGPADPNAL